MYTLYGAMYTQESIIWSINLINYIAYVLTHTKRFYRKHFLFLNPKLALEGIHLP